MDADGYPLLGQPSPSASLSETQGWAALSSATLEVRSLSEIGPRSFTRFVSSMSEEEAEEGERSRSPTPVASWFRRFISTMTQEELVQVEELGFAHHTPKADHCRPSSSSSHVASEEASPESPKAVTFLRQTSTDTDTFQRQISQPTVANSLAAWSRPSQTLIFLDWDDTIFPTTEIVDNWGLSSKYDTWSSAVLSAEQERLLGRWCDALHKYLTATCSLSDRCVIITNSRRPWVSECVKRFAPSLESLFSRDDGPHVVYANEAVASKVSPCASVRRNASPVRFRAPEALSPEEQREQLTKAKFAAMRQEAKKFYAQYPEQTWKNIISIGDARYEHDAAQDLAFRRKGPAREQLRLKTVVTPTEPSIRDLIYQMRLVTLLWPAHVHFDGDFDIDMNTSESLKLLADELGMPDLRALIRQTPVPPCIEEALAEEFDEVTLLVQDHIYQ